jgi:2-polyprenyl-3-methyl-5-hydroxy-6-metoxy-1,4-benzoquinol methylase
VAATVTKAILDAAPPKAVQRWSASDYARNARFVQELAGPVFAMLAPRPGEHILDLGCGDGALTAERLQVPAFSASI